MVHNCLQYIGKLDTFQALQAEGVWKKLKVLVTRFQLEYLLKWVSYLIKAASFLTFKLTDQ